MKQDIQMERIVYMEKCRKGNKNMILNPTNIVNRDDSKDIGTQFHKEYQECVINYKVE